MSRPDSRPQIRQDRSIAARILIAIFLISSAATVIVTAIELAIDYGHGEDGIIDGLTHAVSSSKVPLARALWDVDDATARATLDGLIKLAHVHGAEVTGSNSGGLAAGVTPTPDDLVVNSPLVYLDGKEERVLGELRLTSRRQDYNGAFARKAIVFVIIRALKAMLASLFIYWAIHGILTRHLIAISRYIKNFAVPRRKPLLNLGRKKARNDELDTLADAINDMQGRLDQSFNSLGELNATLERRVEEQTRIAIERQKQLDASARLSALGRMAAGISHEIKNPLAMILGNVQLLQKLLAMPNPDQEQLRQRLEKCEKGVFRIDRIVAAMSKLMASESDQFELEAVPLRGVLEDLRDLSELRCKKDLIELSVELPEDDVLVRGSSTQLCQVLLNLVSNACDALAGVQSAKICVTCAKEHGRVAVQVRDNGHGISPENLLRIMEPFFTTKDPGKGVGLGLSLSRSMIERFGGSMTVTSVAGDTRFTVTLLDAITPQRQSFSA